MALSRKRKPNLMSDAIDTIVLDDPLEAYFLWSYENILSASSAHDTTKTADKIKHLQSVQHIVRVGYKYSCIY